ncbi:MAG: acyl-CoA dehydrogenase family protein [Actinomycetota bacterium]
MPDTILPSVARLSAEFAADRKQRQRCRFLDAADFERLRATGFPLLPAPVEHGGHWRSAAESVRPICEGLRLLAGGDPSLALVAAMHPSVLAFWAATPEAPAPFDAAWQRQRSEIFATVRDGAWWGTITSEPGSGGDVTRTRTQAQPDGDGYRITGAKHFGSGSGISSYVLTSAAPIGEPQADWFYLNVRQAPWDGGTGMTLLAEWDGAGMAATQSHAFRFDAFPATRFAWPQNMLRIQQAAGGPVACYFTAVITGVASAAMVEARRQLAQRSEELRPFEQVEWARSEVDHWLIEQAHEGMIHAIESEAESPLGIRCGKVAIAELAESLLSRLCRVLGGGTFSRQSPFSYWYEDVRALGFLRPPWGLAFDGLYQSARSAVEATGD